MVYSFVLSPELEKHKKNRVLRQSKGYFIEISCKGCEKETLCYSHSQTVIRCNACGVMLVKPTGGHANLLDTCMRKNTIAENNY